MRKGIFMDSLEPKKLALLRILQILQEHSDGDHLLTQDEIVELLNKEYGLAVERKAVGRNLSLLKEAGFDVVTSRQGSYLDGRPFENAELRLLIDSVLGSKHISPTYTKALIEKLTGLSNKYFKSHIKNIYSINDWNKAQNADLFLNIELVDEAIEANVCVSFLYNKYGEDKKLHSTSKNLVSPYQMILHNQHYYLIAYNHKWERIRYYRMDKITEMELSHEKRMELRSIKGYENGIDYKKISSCLPYMFTDQPERVEFYIEKGLIDQVVDWFGYEVEIKDEGDRFFVTLTVSPNAMEYWAMQYLNFVEVISPQSLRDRLRENLAKATEKYSQ
jgi:predicted DNA-binding transcriptional regulator YafY